MSDGLTPALMEVHREMRSILNAVARRSELTAQQIEMLCILERRQPSFGELAELIGCDKTNITGTADRLVRRGLVRRMPDPHDRRVTRLLLTDRGRNLGMVLKRAVAVAVEQRWGDLGASERAALARLQRPERLT